MEPSKTRSVIMYGLTGTVLLVAIVLGVQFAKNRATQVAADKQQIATTQAGGEQQQQQPAGGNEGNNNQTSPQTSDQPVTTPATGGSTLGSNTDLPTQVPATGDEHLVAAVLGLVALGFSIGIYAKSRRRLMTIG